MRTRILQVVAVATLALLCVGQAADASSLGASHSTSSKAQLRTQLSRQFHRAKVVIHPDTGAVTMLGGSPARPIATSGQLGRPASARAAAETFLARNEQLFGVGRGSTLTLSRAESASEGRTILRYQQLYRGVPVLAGDVVVDVTRRNDIISVNGEAANGIAFSVHPTVSAARAQQSAIAQIAHDRNVPASSLHASTPHRWIYDARLIGPEGARGSWLVWRLNVTSDVSPMNELALVDAQRGGVLLHFDQIEAVAPNRIICDRHNVSQAEKTCGTAGEPIVIHPDKSGYPGASADAQRAFDYSGNTWTYYFKRFGRNSLDGKGLQLKSTVRFCDPRATCPYANAYWNGTQMFYGDGYAGGDDVDGHELTHGFTSFTSNLLYIYESGAINEAMSDIMGEFIDQDFHDTHGNDTPSAKWKIGEDIPGFPNGLRDMKTPANGNPKQPDRISSPFWFAKAVYQCYQVGCDNGGVHYNSGVANKAAYLLGEDAGHAPISFNGQSIKPLGRDKTARLFFEVDGTLLTSGSGYRDLAVDMNQACKNLLGVTPKTIAGQPSPTGAFTNQDCQQVAKAVTATEMTRRAVNGAPVSAPACASGQPAFIYNDPIEYTQAQVNGGQLPWTVTGDKLWFVDNTNATSQQPNKAVHDFFGQDFGTTTLSNANAKDSFLTMKTAKHLPANAFLRFKQWYIFDNGQDYLANHQAKYDGGRVEYSTDGGATWKDLGPLFNSNGYNSTIDSTRGNSLAGKKAFGGQSDGYYASRANLASLANKNVKFRWHLATDKQYAEYGWFLDDIAIYTCH